MVVGEGGGVMLWFLWKDGMGEEGGIRGGSDVEDGHAGLGCGNVRTSKRSA